VRERQVGELEHFETPWSGNLLMGHEEEYIYRAPILKFHKEPHMNDPKEPPKETPELTEDALNQVAGGAVDRFLTLDGIDGESSDDKHKSAT
jgi:hypothetical protein